MANDPAALAGFFSYLELISEAAGELDVGIRPGATNAHPRRFVLSVMRHRTTVERAFSLRELDAAPDARELLRKRIADMHRALLQMECDRNPHDRRTARV